MGNADSLMLSFTGRGLAFGAQKRECPDFDLFDENETHTGQLEVSEVMEEGRRRHAEYKRSRRLGYAPEPYDIPTHHDYWLWVLDRVRVKEGKYPCGRVILLIYFNIPHGHLPKRELYCKWEDIILTKAEGEPIPRPCYFERILIMDAGVKCLVELEPTRRVLAGSNSYL